MEKFNKSNKMMVGVVGIIIGALIIMGICFITYKPVEETHYHANFAVYIDGKQEQFSNPLLYEEISDCTISTTMKPAERAHIHDQIKDVVHVEDEAVTWGNFFQNIGWGVSKSYIDNSDTLLINNATKKVSYILNGKTVDDVAKRIIGDKDRLLISYGESTTDQLNQQFATVASSAEKYDTTKDPASCSGGHSENGFKDRMKHLL